MSRLWTCGFELNSTSMEYSSQTASGATVAVQSSIVRSGGYALRTSCATVSSTGYISKTLAGSNQSTAIYARFYLYITTLPSSAVTILSLINSGGTTTVSLKMTTGGALQLAARSGTQIGSNSSALSTGQWYRIELKDDATVSPSLLDAQIDGVSFASGTNSGAGAWTSMSVGMVSGGSVAYDFCLDDIAVNVDDATSQNGYPGSGKVVHLRPNATGDNNDGTIGGSAPASTTWQSINEVTPDDGVTYVSFTSTENILDVNIDNTSTAGINSYDSVSLVQVGLRWAATTAASCASQLRIKSQASGTVLNGTSTTTAQTTFATYSPNTTNLPTLTSYTDPQAGGAWTPALLDTAQIGISSTDVTPNPLFSSLWAIVEYIPGIAPTNPTLTGISSIKGLSSITF